MTCQSEADMFRFWLNYAVLAPSAYNSQPWLWKLNGEELELWVDRSRAVQTIDPEGRELYLACGAALFNLRTAMRQFGYQPEVTILPDEDDLEFVASIRIGGAYWPSDRDHNLFSAIMRRRTCRAAFQESGLPRQFLFDVKSIARAHGARLRVITPAEREAVVKIIETGVLEENANELFRREVSSWLRAQDDQRQDGVLSAAFPAVYDITARDVALATGAPALVLLDTDSDTHREWIVAGEALEHVLLHATCMGICVSYFNQPIHISALWRQLLQKLKLSSFPQLLFRFGIAAEASDLDLSPRRPVSEVLQVIEAAG